MSLLLAARRPYVSETITVVHQDKPKQKSLKHMVMFPDKTGDVFLLDRVPPILADTAKRRQYFLAQEIGPVVKLTVVNGLLEVIPLTDDPSLVVAVDAFFNDANSGLGVSYLLAWGYITEDHIKGAIASRNYVAALGSMTPKEAAASVNADYMEYRGQVRAKCRQVLGLPDVKKAAQFTPKPDPYAQTKPMKSAEPPSAEPPKSNVPNASKASEKAMLIAKAEKLGIKARKSWTCAAIRAEIQKAEALMPAIPTNADLA